MGDFVVDLKMYLCRSVVCGGQSNLFGILVEESLSQRIFVGMGSSVRQLIVTQSAS